MTEIIYGSYGSGKTTEIFKRIKKDTENKKRCFLIIPDQEAVVFERLSLTVLPPTSQLFLEILSFSRLYNRVCREYGGLSYSYVTNPMRSLLMYKTLRELEPLISEYAKVSSDPALSDLMIATINDLKASGISASALENAARKLPSDSSLSKRLRDVALIYSCFDNYVNEKYSDSADDLSRLRDILTEHDFFADSSVYIDSFTSFTAVQQGIIDLMIKSADKVTLTVPLSSIASESISAQSIARSALKLRRSATELGELSEITLFGNKRVNSPAIAYLADNLWNLEKASSSDAPKVNGDVVCEICKNPYSEAQAVASHIRKLLYEGARCRDIVVLARDPDKYRGIIEPALKNADIPFFMAQKSDLCTVPAIKFLLSALKIKRYNWQRGDVISHIKTGLCDVDPHDANLFEEYVNMWSISSSRFLEDDWNMNPDGFVPEVSERGAAILAAANKVRATLTEPLLRYFVLLDASDTIADMCRATYRYLCDVRLEEKLAELSRKAAERGDIKQAKELSRIYSIILNSLADIGEIIGDEEADADEFAALLKTVFDKTEIGSIPTSIDEVTVGNAQMLRASDKKYAFVIGLCENEFPATVEDTGVFSSNDKEALGALGIEFTSDIDSRASNELMYVERSFAIPSDRLYLLTHSSKISGASCFPSLAFNRVFALFDGFKPHVFECEDLEYLVPSPKNAAAILRIINDRQIKSSLSLALDKHIPGIREKAEMNTAETKCRVSEETVSALYGKALRLNPSSLEKYVKCPLDYYCSNVLSLRESKTAEFKSNDIGTYIHYLLEDLIKKCIPSEKDQPFPDDEALEKLIDQTAEDYLRRICPEYMLESAKMRHLNSRLKTLSAMVVKNIIAEFSSSDFTPAFFELKTNGSDDNPSPLVFSLENDRSISLSGSVDRVDLYKKDGRVYIRVVDYKTGTKSFSLEDIREGMNLQMLIYLFALTKSDSPSFRRSIGAEGDPVEAGVIYFSSSVDVLDLGEYEEYSSILKRASESIKRTGILLNDEEILRAMNHDLDKRFIVGIYKKANEDTLRGNALTSGERFAEAYKQLKDVVSDIARQIFSGRADAAPRRFERYIPCTYCKAKPICRRMNDTEEE